MKPLIEIEGLTYQHPRLEGQDQTAYQSIPPALREVSITIQPGEYVAIIGANGSGKTTFVRHLNALLLPTTGTVKIQGMDTREVKNHTAIRSTVGMIFQFPEDQIVATTVEEDVAFGPENLGLLPQEIQKRVDGALKSVHIEHLKLRPPYQLSAGQVQRVALAGMLAVHPNCIIFDEATAMLDPAGRQELLTLIQQLHEEGLTILYITHFMEEAALAQRVIVFHEGRVEMDGSPRDIFSQTDKLQALGLEPPPVSLLAQQIHPYIPSLSTNVLTLKELVNQIPNYGKASNTIPISLVANSEPEMVAPIIDVENLSHWYGVGSPFEQQALNQVSMKVKPGELYGLVGATGSGKSTLLQHFNGLYRPQTGKIRVESFNLQDPKINILAVRKMVGLVFQLPEAQLFEQYVGDEIAFGPRRMGLTGDELRESVRRAMELVGLGFEQYKDRLTFTLSGGERRKVALASVIAVNPKILLLDEPTAGLDPKSRHEFFHQLDLLLAQGVTLVISSHRMEDLAERAQSVTILDQGSVAMGGSAERVFTRQDVLLESGLRVPLAVQLADAFRHKGWPIPEQVIRIEQLVQAISSLSQEIIHE